MRLHWIDALKGFGIILVVFAHLISHKALFIYIASFVLPLLFFTSGFLLDFSKYEKSITGFINGRLRSLIVPYFYFAFLTGIFFFLLDKVYQPGITNVDFFKSSALYEIYSVFYGNGSLVSYNQALWFLTCLFVTELIFYGFAKKSYSKPRKLILWLTASGIIGYLYSVYVPFRLPWGADIALCAVVFYGAGNLLRNFIEPKAKSRADPEECFSLESNLKFRKILSLAEKFFPGVFVLLNLLYLVYLIEFSTTYQYLDMNNLKYGSFFSFYILAFSGTFAYIYLFKKIGGSKVLEYLGRNTLIILVLHIPIRDVLKNLTAMSLGVKPEYLTDNLVFALSLTVLNLLCLIPLIFLINNYFPFLIGKKGSSAKFEGLKTRLRNFKYIGSLFR